MLEDSSSGLVAFSPEQWTAFWTGITAVATLFIAGAAVVFGLVETKRGRLFDAQRSESEERASRDRRAAEEADAVKEAALLRVVKPMGNKFLRIDNVGSHAFSNVVVRRFDVGEQDDPGHIEELEPEMYDEIRPGERTTTHHGNYFSVAYTDHRGRRFENDDGAGPRLVSDPTSDAST